MLVSAGFTAYSEGSLKPSRGVKIYVLVPEGHLQISNIIWIDLVELVTNPFSESLTDHIFLSNCLSKDRYLLI